MSTHFAVYAHKVLKAMLANTQQESSLAPRLQSRVTRQRRVKVLVPSIARLSLSLCVCLPFVSRLGSCSVLFQTSPPTDLPSSKYCLGLYATEFEVGVSKVLVVEKPMWWWYLVWYVSLSVHVARALLLYVFIFVWIRYLFSYSSTGLYSVRLA